MELLVMKQKIRLSWCLNWWVCEKLQTRVAVVIEINFKGIEKMGLW